MNFLNICLMILLLYVSVTFCAVWNDWAGAVLILWILILIADFLVMELTLEILIALFYSCRGIIITNFFYKLFLGIKNLRNTH